MQKLRWGVIGCGDIASKRVIPALQQLPHCQLQAVARANSQLVELYAQEVGANTWFRDWQDLVSSDQIDAVYVATPVYVHEEQVIAAATAGKHVLCEKPMAMSAQACERMIEACSKHGVSLGVAYYRHFYPAVLRVQEIIESGEIGQVTSVQMDAFEWFEREPGEPRYWLLNKQQAGGGPMMDFGCHRIEVLLHLFGSIKDIQSRIFNLHFDRQVEDTAYVSLLFENRTHAMIRVSHAAHQPRDTLDLYGTQGTINIPVLNEGTLTVRTAAGEKTEHCPPHQNTHLPLIEDFTSAVLTKGEPTVGGDIGRAVAMVTDKVYMPGGHA